MEMPRFNHGMVKANALALEDVMEMSAMTKSAVPSATSPNMPFHCPFTKLPY